MRLGRRRGPGFLKALLAAAALADGVSAVESSPAVAKPEASVEVYYLTTCPHCLDFLQKGFLDVIEAELPGDRVELTLLPVLKGMSSPDQCLATEACKYALAALCALRDTFPQPAAADAAAFRRSTRFVACDMVATASGSGRPTGTVEDCAKEANLPWGGSDGLQACADGPKAFGIMYSPDYAQEVLAAMHRLRLEHFRRPPSMPWIFLNGEFLTCAAGECRPLTRVDTGANSPNATEQRTSLADNKTEPGPLLQLICDKLSDPKPKACAEALAKPRNASHAEGATHAEAPPCESC